MSRLRNVSLVKIGSVMVVGGLLGMLTMGGILGSFYPYSMQAPSTFFLTLLVLLSFYGGLILLVLIALRSITREWSSGRPPNPRKAE